VPTLAVPAATVAPVVPVVPVVPVAPCAGALILTTRALSSLLLPSQRLDAGRPTGIFGAGRPYPDEGSVWRNTHMFGMPRRWWVVRRGFQPIMWRIFAPLVLAVPAGVAITSAMSPHPSVPPGNPPSVVHVETVMNRSGASTGMSVGSSVGAATGTYFATSASTGSSDGLPTGAPQPLGTPVGPLMFAARSR
jgi:hypothetical protein